MEFKYSTPYSVLTDDEVSEEFLQEYNYKLGFVYKELKCKLRKTEPFSGSGLAVTTKPIFALAEYAEPIVHDVPISASHRVIKAYKKSKTTIRRPAVLR